MRFEINRITMHRAALSAVKVIPTKVSADIINGILIECDSDTSEVFITSTNHAVSFQIKLDATVVESGRILVNPQLFVGILSMLPCEKAMFYAEGQNVLIIEGGRCVYEVKCLPPNNYPKPVMPFPDDTVRIKGICSLTKRTSFATSTEDSKPALQCVSVKLNQNTLQAVACDGIRLIILNEETQSSDDVEFLLPGASLRTLASMSTDNDVFEVADIGNEIAFMKENMLFTMRKVTGTFVDANMIVDYINPLYKAEADANKIREALELIDIASGGQPVNIIFMDGQICLNCNGENGAVQSSVAADISANTPIDGFYYDASMLKKVFLVIDGKVKFGLDSKGILLAQTKKEIYLQMPLASPAVKNKSKEGAA